MGSLQAPRLQCLSCSVGSLSDACALGRHDLCIRGGLPHIAEVIRSLPFAVVCDISTPDCRSEMLHKAASQGDTPHLRPARGEVGGRGGEGGGGARGGGGAAAVCALRKRACSEGKPQELPTGGREI